MPSMVEIRQINPGRKIERVKSDGSGQWEIVTPVEVRKPVEGTFVHGDDGREEPRESIMFGYLDMLTNLVYDK